MLFPIIFLVVIFSITGNCNAESTNNIPADAARVYNGTFANNSLPFYVALMVQYSKGRDYQLICGGSLIDNQHVLTAAHCTLAMNCGVGQTKCEAWLAPKNLSQFDGLRIPITSVNDVYTHPNYKSDNLYADVGIVRLSKRVTLGRKYKRICIGNFTRINERPVRLVGFGLYNCKDISDRLREASGMTVDGDKCKEIKPAGSVCARLKNGKGGFADADPGDSGSPLFTTIKGLGGRRIYAQLGIVSFGIPTNSTLVNGAPADPCPSPEYPGVYSVPSYFPRFLRQYARPMFCYN